MSKSDIKKWRSTVRFTSEVQKLCPEDTYTIAFLKWHLKVRSRIDFQMWHQNIMYKSDVQKWRQKETSKSDAKKWHQKFTFKSYVQQWDFHCVCPSLRGTTPHCSPLGQKNLPLLQQNAFRAVLHLEFQITLSWFSAWKPPLLEELTSFGKRESAPAILSLY